MASGSRIVPLKGSLGCLMIWEVCRCWMGDYVLLKYFTILFMRFNWWVLGILEGCIVDLSCI